MSIDLDSLSPPRRGRDDPAGVPTGVSQEVAQAVSSRSRLSFRQGMDKARAQIDLTQFYRIDVRNGAHHWIRTKESDLAESLLMAMGEVYSAYADKIFYVGGEERTADEIAYVYEMIDTDMMYRLVERLENEVGGNPVKYQRPYLRTMLYNEVFEAAIKELAEKNNT